jgi:hypothetical protein
MASLPTAIRGYVSDDTFFGVLDALETVPDLTWPVSTRVYAQMRHDSRLTAVVEGYTLQLRRAQWQLSSAGCRPELVQMVADDLGLPIAGKDEPQAARTRGVSWNQHLASALSKLTFGHAGYEMQAEVVDGKARLVGLWERPQWTITQIFADGKTGEFQGISQDLGANGSWKTPQIKAQNMVWHVHNREGANWAGTSILRSAYAAWLFKREALKVLATSSRRFGMGVPTVEWAPGTNPTPQQMAEAARAASAARVGDQSGLTMPPGASLVLKGLSGGTPDTLAFLKWLNTEMASAALMPHLDLGNTESGSRALGTAFIDSWMLALQSIGSDIADTVTRQVTARIVDWNFGPDEPVPAVTVAGIGSNREVTAESLQLLLSSGALAADPGLEEWVRREYRLPEREEPPAASTPPTRVRPAGAEQPQDDQQTGDGERIPDGEQPDAVQASAQPRRGRRRYVPDGQLELPIAAAGREPTAAEQQSGVDPDQLDADLQRAQQELADQWPEMSAPMVATIVTAVAAAVAAGGFANLPSYAVPAATLRGITTRIRSALTGLAGVSARRAAAELKTQGLTVQPGDVDADRITDVAEATAHLLASGYVNAAARVALLNAGADPDTVQRAVRQHLDELSQAPERGWVAQTLSSALATAQAEGRLATFRAAPAGLTFVASEASDRNACEPCRREDGTRYPSLADAIRAYPAGRFRGCLGRDRCRGRLIAIVPEGR